jgi:hypothetical protein
VELASARLAATATMPVLPSMSVAGTVTTRHSGPPPTDPTVNGFIDGAPRDLSLGTACPGVGSSNTCWVLPWASRMAT